MGQDITDAETLLALEDLAVGQHFTSGTHVLDTAQIKSFAVQFYPQRRAPRQRLTRRPDQASLPVPRRKPDGSPGQGALR